MKNGTRPMTILLVENNVQDIEITRRAFAKGEVRSDLVVTRDGEEALDYLHRRGKFQDPRTSPRPAVILLDLNLPKVGGLEVLQQVKRDESLKAIPIIVLTVSQQEEDVIRSYDLGVNTYVQKPLEFDEFVRVINTIHDYWSLVATLPSRAID